MAFFLSLLLLVGLISLIGAGIFRRWLAPEHPPAGLTRALRAGIGLGAFLVIAASFGEVAQVLINMLGRIDPAMVRGYLSETRHGQSIWVRILATLALVALEHPRLRGPILRYVLYLPAAILLAAAVSGSSHAAGTGSLLAIVADAAHLLAAAAWVGAVIGLALPLAWFSTHARPGFITTLNRASRMALASWIVILITGAYGAYLQIWGIPALFGTPYGDALLIKLGLVAGVLMLAAANRWWFMPSLEPTASPGRVAWTLRVEAALLVAVLIAAAVLINRIPPTTPTVLAQEKSFTVNLKGNEVSGHFLPHERGYEVRLTIDSQEEGFNPPDALRMTLNMPDHDMVPSRITLQSTGNHQFVGYGLFPMPGIWEARIRLFEEDVSVEMLAIDP